MSGRSAGCRTAAYACAALFLLAGCAGPTPYQKKSAGEGYYDYEIQPGIHYVSFRANGETTRSTVMDYWYRRAAEICGGEDRFEVIGMDSFGAQITETRDRASGLLRITSSVAFGSIWLVPRIREFLELYPDIAVNLLVEDSELDLGMREADCAIRMQPPRQPDLIQRHLISVHIHVFAAPAYLKKYGTPQTTADLDRHKIVVYGEDPRPPFPGINWLLEAGCPPGQRRTPVLQVNNVYAILRAVENGVGIAAFPDYMAQESTKIVQILPNLDGPTYEAYFVYAEEMRNSKRIAVFRDFLVRKVSDTQF